MKKITTILSVSLFIVGLLAAGWGCQDQAGSIESQENNNTEAVVPVVTPASSPVVTEIETAEYTNKKYNYKITLPSDYSAVVESRDSQDKVIVYDNKDQVFATIWTPTLETGFEVWEKTTEKNIAVPGSDKSLVWKKMLPDDSSGTETGKVVVTWGDPESDFVASGLIVHDFDPATESSVKTFETMIKTLRFI